MDSRYKNQEERRLDSIALMEARLNRMKSLSREQITRAKLMQLKLQMEAYLKETALTKDTRFTDFLGSYIETLYSRQNEFARDINVTPVFLSQVINHHREPNEEFMLKLMVHSDKAFKNVGGFQKKIWYEVYFHQKISNTLSTQKEWMPAIEKQVKFG